MSTSLFTQRCDVPPRPDGVLIGSEATD